MTPCAPQPVNHHGAFERTAAVPVASCPRYAPTVADHPAPNRVPSSAGFTVMNGNGSRVVLSAEATNKASIHMAGASFTPKTRVTSKTKGGGKVWAEIQRLAEAIQKAP
jgi:hypothetical protein